MLLYSFNWLILAPCEIISVWFNLMNLLLCTVCETMLAGRLMLPSLKWNVSPNSLQRCNESKQATGSQMAVVEGQRVALPLVHNLVMRIYHIILSPQHNRCSMSATACQVGPRKTANAADQTAVTAVCSKCADSGHRAPYGTAGWWCRACRHVLPSLSLYSYVCIYLPLFVHSFW